MYKIRRYNYFIRTRDINITLAKSNNVTNVIKTQKDQEKLNSLKEEKTKNGI